MRSESLFVSAGARDRLHLRRIGGAGDPVLLLHGAIENGRVFYSESGKGFAPYLAEHGFDAFVGDLRGRGLSRPAISARSTHGQHEAITEDLPAFVDAIRSIHGDRPQIWCGHSWGGVLLLSFLARFPERLPLVRALVFFGTKRRIQVVNWERRWSLDLFWNTVASLATSLFGYLPAREMRVGADNETRSSHLESKLWVKPRSAWRDLRDGFDYGTAIRRIRLPRSLWLAGALDRCLGHPFDVRDLMRETGADLAEFRILPGYGHIDMLTGPAARQDHFASVVAWLR